MDWVEVGEVEREGTETSLLGVVEAEAMGAERRVLREAEMESTVWRFSSSMSVVGRRAVLSKIFG